MISLRNRYIAGFLGLIFAFALAPVELFHHHEWESELCQENELHFADHSIDCELADFSISKMHPKTDAQEQISNKLYDLYTALPELDVPKPLPYFLRDRGPPELNDRF